MATDRVRGFIAICIVITTCIVLLLLTILNALNAEEGSYTDMMKTWGSVMSGTLGTILGYYFGKGQGSTSEQRTGVRDD